MADNEQNQTPAKPVDDAPISPIERKNSLENHLMHRPDRAALVDSTCALQAAIPSNPSVRLVFSFTASRRTNAHAALHDRRRREKD